MGSPVRLITILALGVVVSLGACSSEGGHPVTSSSRTISPTSPASPSSMSSTTSGFPSASTSTPDLTPTGTVPSVAGQVGLTETDEGHTVGAHPGDVIVATLHNTYWRFAPPGPGLTQIGQETITPAPRGTCLPGVGCGTVIARYRATASGASDVRASRTSCGEALACAPGQGEWTVRVLVS